MVQLLSLIASSLVVLSALGLPAPGGKTPKYNAYIPELDTRSSAELINRDLELDINEALFRRAASYAADCTTQYYVFASGTGVSAGILDEPTVYVANLKGADTSTKHDQLLKVVICDNGAGGLKLNDVTGVYCAGGRYRAAKGVCNVNFFNAAGLSPTPNPRQIYLNSQYGSPNTVYTVDSSGVVGATTNGGAVVPWIKGAGQLIVGYAPGTDPGAGYTQVKL